MKISSITLAEKDGIDRYNEPVRLGIPIGKGLVFDADELTLSNEGNTLKHQIYPATTWPDGSIRWIHCLLQTDLAAYSSISVELLKDTNSPGKQDNVAIEEHENHIIVNTNDSIFKIDKYQLSWSVSTGDLADFHSLSKVELTGVDNFVYHTKLDAPWEILESGESGVTMHAIGDLNQEDSCTFARFTCALRFYKEVSFVEIEFTIHNPKRAMHTGGLWDLGDQGSIHFKELAVKCHFPGNDVKLRLDENNTVYTGKDLPVFVYQDSSGGEEWNSLNHIDANGNLTVNFQGYRVYEGDSIIKKGYRASPVLHKKANDTGVSIALPKFWQNFPSSLESYQNHINIGLFPKWSHSSYELQGGERKTQTCYIDYKGTETSLLWVHSPLVPVLSPNQYEKANAFPWFKITPHFEKLKKLIEDSLDKELNFFEKREAIDEYGWRNFGEIFADHETLYQAPNEPALISHYNNQYDGIYGFARQFALTGDTRWYCLMSDLAQHVTDIDIYHTREDRAEYNNGLFWHTDHYLEACRATHRTYSAFQSSPTLNKQLGGGPGAEHCYTTGLLYHYLLTGSISSKNAVLELANWMVALHEGAGGLLEQLFAIKSKDAPKIRSLIKGEKVSPHSYPFTRGTGNYITALLDAWLATNDGSWIKQAELVIKNTIHPHDDISSRNLLDAENNWSYLVLLESIAKYLHCKLEANSIDGEFQYALDAYCTYTRWIVKNEKLFLSESHNLEYPNDTWTAQDIRKAMLLFKAMHFDPDMKDIYLKKAQEWLEHVVNKLYHSPEQHFARIKILLMLNYGPQDFLESESLYSGMIRPNLTNTSFVPSLSWKDIITQILRRITHGLITFSPRKEVLWLNSRLKK